MRLNKRPRFRSLSFRMERTAPTTKRRLLMFDLDGTLIDSGRDIRTAVNLLRKDYGLPPLPLRTVVGYVGDGLGKLVERALRGHPADLEAATERCAAHYRNHLHDKTRLYPGVRQGLRRLRRAGYLLAVISNKPKSSCVTILRHFRIHGLFAYVLGGGDTRFLKPDPEPLRTVMRRLRIRKDRSWMIGDHKTDLEAGRRAGVRTVFLTHGIGETGREKPGRVFSSFGDMVAFLANPARRSALRTRR